MQKRIEANKIMNAAAVLNNMGQVKPPKHPVIKNRNRRIVTAKVRIDDDNDTDNKENICPVAVRKKKDALSKEADKAFNEFL